MGASIEIIVLIYTFGIVFANVQVTIFTAICGESSHTTMIGYHSITSRGKIECATFCRMSPNCVSSEFSWDALTCTLFTTTDSTCANQVVQPGYSFFQKVLILIIDILNKLCSVDFCKCTVKNLS